MKKITTAFSLLMALSFAAPTVYADEPTKEKEKSIFVFIKADEAGDEIYKSKDSNLWNIMWKTNNGITVDKDASKTFDKPSFYKTSPNPIDNKDNDEFINCAPKL